MANLAILFKQAEKQLSYTGIGRSDTQEVLELRDKQNHRIQGFAWRPISGGQVLQVYPPTKDRKTLRDGSYFVIKGAKSEWKFYDPNHRLKEVWSYVGCPNCSDLSSDEVWGWISQAHEYLMKDKNR